MTPVALVDRVRLGGPSKQRVGGSNPGVYTDALCREARHLLLGPARRHGLQNGVVSALSPGLAAFGLQPLGLYSLFTGEPERI
jgi:hypothetical protein